MPATPRIADVSCTRLRFEPGDRLLVRSRHRLDAEQQRRLRKSIQCWAGCEVEVLIYCVLDMEVEVDKRITLPGEPNR